MPKSIDELKSMIPKLKDHVALSARDFDDIQRKLAQQVQELKSADAAQTAFGVGFQVRALVLVARELAGIRSTLEVIAATYAADLADQVENGDGEGEEGQGHGYD